MSGSQIIKTLVISLNENVFKPTATTHLLINSILEEENSPGRLLDLGSGCGIVGIALFKAKLAKDKLYSSDVSVQAVENTRINCKQNKVPVETKIGSILEPWQNHKFDYIVDDISGVAEKIAEISPWFKNIPCDSGEDGAKLTIEVLRSSPSLLNKNGNLYFPIINFSNKDKILMNANKYFSDVRCVSRVEWPIPQEINEHIDLMIDMKKQGTIDYTEKLGISLGYTEIYKAKI